MKEGEEREKRRATEWTGLTEPPDHVAHLIEILITAASVNGEIILRIDQLWPRFKLAEPMATVPRFNAESPGPTMPDGIVRETRRDGARFALRAGARASWKIHWNGKRIQL